MEPWLNTLVTALVVSPITLFGIWAGNKLQKRAVATQEAQTKHEYDFGLTDRWQNWAEEQEEARRNDAINFNRQMEAIKGDLTRAVGQVETFGEWIDELVDYIGDLLNWANEPPEHRAAHYPVMPRKVSAIIRKERPDVYQPE